MNLRQKFKIIKTNECQPIHQRTLINGELVAVGHINDKSTWKLSYVSEEIIMVDDWISTVKTTKPVRRIIIHGIEFNPYQSIKKIGVDYYHIIDIEATYQQYLRLKKSLECMDNAKTSSDFYELYSKINDEKDYKTMQKLLDFIREN